MGLSPNKSVSRAVALATLVVIACFTSAVSRASEEDGLFAERLAKKIGADGLDKWPHPLMRPPPLLPEASWEFFVPDLPPEPSFFDRLEVKPAYATTLRPTGVPWFLPGELGTNKNGDPPGPGVGFSLNWRPSKHWRFGADLVVRAERVDSNHRLHDWTPYLAPGFEFIPYPYSSRPFAIGFVTPWALHPRGEDWAGAFLFIRWNELLNQLPRAKAK
jgi:hypothetical protein